MSVRLESHFGDLAEQHHAARLGTWIFLSSELLLFAALFALYFAYRREHPEVFAAAVRHNQLVGGTINTCILLLGSTAAAVAVQQLRLDRRRLAALLLLGTGLAAVAFLAIKGREYATHLAEGIGPSGGAFFARHPEPGWPAFFTLYYASTGLHAIHVAVGGILLAVAACWILLCRIGREGAHRVELATLYWHFVDLVWIFLWPMYYLLGGHR